MLYSRRRQEVIMGNTKVAFIRLKPTVTETGIYEMGIKALLGVYSGIKHWLNIFKWLISQV